MQLFFFCSPILRRTARLLWGAVPFLLSVSLVSGLQFTTPQPSFAQTVNQTYDCGTYGAGDYGSNDCVAAVTTPSPTASVTPTPKAGTAGLPVTGTQLIWIAVIGIGLISLGVALSLRRTRRWPRWQP